MQNSPDSSGWKIALARLAFHRMECEKGKALGMPSINE